MTIDIHGRRIDLAVLKRALFGRQGDVAKRAGVSQPTVSNYLTGKTPYTRTFVTALEQIITPQVAANLANRSHHTATPAVQKTITTPPSQAGPAQTQPRQVPVSNQPPTPQQPVPIPGQSPTATVVQDTDDDATVSDPGEGPQRETVTPEKGVIQRDWDVGKFHKLSELVQNAHRTGDINFTVAVRHNINASKAYYLLAAEGFSADDALVGAYDLTVRSRTEPGSADRRFAEEVFHTVYGLEAGDCKVPAGAPADWHPSTALVFPLAKAGLPVWIYGEKGTGKTHAAKQIAGRLNGYYQVQCDRDTTKDDFIGVMTASGGSTAKADGPLALAMREGKLLIVEEPTIADPSVLMLAQQVLTGEPLVITGLGEVETLYPAEGFGFIFCDNTVGAGEGIEYVGTKRQNDAFLDRFYFVEMGHMSRDLHIRIVEQHIADLKAKHAAEWTFVNN